MKMKKILSLVMAIALLAVLISAATVPALAADPSGSWSDYAAASEPVNDGSTYTITSAEQLAWVANQVNSYSKNFAGCTVVLGGPIDLSGHYWVPIGTAAAFQGTFDGRGYEISGLTIADSALKYVGLFGIASGGTIKNVDLTLVSVASSYSSDYGYAGGLVGYTGDDLKDCSVSGSVAFATGNYYVYCGGLAGKAENSDLSGCSASGSVTASMSQMESYCGGLAGDILSGSVTDCLSSATVGSAAMYLGGLAGRLHNTSVTGSSAAGTVNNSYSLYGMGNSGGFAGYASSDSASSVEGSHAEGAVAQGGANGSVGGFIGFGTGYTVSGCYASGNISGGSQSGGFIGNNNSVAVSASYATGSVSGSGGSPYAYGGFVGDNTGTVNQCYATGAVQAGGGTLAGGFAGQTAGAGSITSCYSSGAVGGGFYSGGFAGGVNSAVSDCYATGAVSDGTYAGGFVGICFGSDTNCYWLSGTAAAAAGDTGSGATTALEINSGEMQSADFVASLINSRADALWIAISGVNSGYPVLRGIGDGAATPPAETYTVSGAVASALPSIPLSGLAVGLYASATTDYSGTPLYSAATGGDGSYSVGGVAAGSYIAVVAADAGGAYAQSKSDTFTVSAATTVNSIALNIICTISGTVTLPGGVTPAPGVTLKLYDYDFMSGKKTYLASATADGGGNYNFPVGIPDADTHFYLIYASSYTSGGTTYSDNAGIALVSLSAATAYVADISLVDLSGSWVGHVQTPGGYTEGDTAITISTSEQLAWLAQRSVVNGEAFRGVTINLANDLDLSDYDWMPICPNSGFAGTFDGNGHVITGLHADVYIDMATSSIYQEYHAGLFGRVEGGTIKNLGIANAAVSVTAAATAGSYEQGSGALAGSVEKATIENCYSSGNIAVAIFGAYGGGLIGSLYDSAVSSCYSECSVAGDYNYSGFITRSGCGGGLIGYVMNNGTGSAPSISDCYAVGSVSGYCLCNGGLIGNYAGAALAGCYAVGPVGNATYNGCFAGAGYGNTLTNVYWLSREGVAGIASGNTDDVAYIGGREGSAMIVQTFADALNAAGGPSGPWVWHTEVNSGYPALNGVGVGNIFTAPAITVQPENATVTEGDSASFSAAADCYPAPTVKWQVSIDNGASFSDISGAESAAYSFTVALADNGKQYRAVFSNAAGTKTSEAATLMVNKATVAVNFVSVFPPTLALAVGQVSAVQATVSPSDATNQSVTWQSGNTKVATVDGNGVVTAIGAGRTSITVTTADGAKTASCAVSVTKAVTVRAVSISPSRLTITVGQTGTLTALISPANATNTAVTWSSSNPLIASVDANGKVAGLSKGAATITVTTADGKKTAKATVMVKAPVAVTGVTLNKTLLSLYVADSAALTATITPKDAANMSVTWSSDNESAASVNQSGLVTAVGPGIAKITVKTADGGYTATCKVTVKQKVSVNGVTLNKTVLSLKTGRTAYLIATITPAGATDQNLIWATSNNKVVTVGQNGKITAVGSGTATITVTTEDGGYFATCTVTVTRR